MKTTVEIIQMHSPRPTSGYENSWIKNAMKDYAKQWIDRTLYESLTDQRNIDYLTTLLKKEVDEQ